VSVIVKLFSPPLSFILKAWLEFHLFPDHPCSKRYSLILRTVMTDHSWFARVCVCVCVCECVCYCGLNPGQRSYGPCMTCFFDSSSQPLYCGQVNLFWSLYVIAPFSTAYCFLIQHTVDFSYLYFLLLGPPWCLVHPSWTEFIWFLFNLCIQSCRWEDLEPPQLPDLARMALGDLPCSLFFFFCLEAYSDVSFTCSLLHTIHCSDIPSNK
jgi:hypothetical protein